MMIPRASYPPSHAGDLYGDFKRACFLRVAPTTTPRLAADPSGPRAPARTAPRAASTPERARIRDSRAVVSAAHGTGRSGAETRGARLGRLGPGATRLAVPVPMERHMTERQQLAVALRESMTDAPVEVPGADPSAPRASPNSDEVRASIRPGARAEPPATSRLERAQFKRERPTRVEIPRDPTRASPPPLAPRAPLTPDPPPLAPRARARSPEPRLRLAQEAPQALARGEGARVARAVGVGPAREPPRPRERDDARLHGGCGGQDGDERKRRRVQVQPREHHPGADDRRPINGAGQRQQQQQAQAPELPGARLDARPRAGGRREVRSRVGGEARLRRRRRRRRRRRNPRDGWRSGKDAFGKRLGVA